MQNMKKRYIKHLLALCFFSVFAIAVSAQVTTMYYMKGVAQRHELNPSFQPISNFYIDLPVIPTFQFQLGNNSLTISDVLYPRLINGEMKTISFLDANATEADKKDFFNTLKSTTRIYSETQIDLLSLGWRKNKSYYTIGISEKINAAVFLPKDLFKLALYGTPDTINVNKFNLSPLSVQAMAYSEFSFGYSEKFSDKLNLGLKAKLLLGQSHLSAKFSNLKINAAREQWDVSIDGELNGSIPYTSYELDEERKIEDVAFNEPQNSGDYADLFLKPSGVGFAFDLGASYKLLDQLTLSAAILDLGFINWKNNAVNIPVKGDYTFEGIVFDIADDSTDWGEKYLKEIEDTIKYSTTFNDYRANISPKLMAGVEYGFLKDKITLGVVSKSTFVNKSVFQEFTTSANFAPVTWFNTSFSYSFMNGEFSNMGLGVSGRLGPFNLYVVGDYFPLKYTTQYIPHKTGAFDVRVGMFWTFGTNKKSKDDDKDGVKNKKDKCPDTPFGYQVDEEGCIVDADKDGVPDNLDECPDTPLGYQVDEKGCTVDTDKDGVPNNLDKCAGTLNNVPVDEHGCPFDEDGDGVSDSFDKCPKTPAGAVVGRDGCPIDSDGDAVPDYMDKCPGTPVEAKGMIDADGCPKDTDADGVPDYLDKCPGTPVEAQGTVDAKGCPKDTDDDGIPDYLDNCPTIKGTVSDQGCPALKVEEKRIFEKALQGIQFESGKDLIKPVSYTVLNEIVSIMKTNTDYLLDINGHTDNVGDAVKNQELSENRALSVKKYLTSKGIDEGRVNTKGFGQTKPVADNSTVQGRKMNRRVEFVVRFER